jgi:hypothetical protein
MGGTYPLANLQREALHHLLAIEDAQLLAINGPPGTGKTTLIQSVVANYYVSAALQEKEAPVIFAASANNNAVTNILDSFAAATVDARSSDPLTRRWLPKLFSFGLYLPAASQKADEAKYHVARLPNFGRALAGWPAAMMESIEAAEAAYMQTARAYLREDFRTIADIRGCLLQRLRGLRDKVHRVLNASEAVLACRATFAPQSPDQVRYAFARQEACANEEAAKLRSLVRTAKSDVAAAQKRLHELEAACDDALRAFSPPGLIHLLLGIIPQVRAQRWDNGRAILGRAGFDEGLFSSLKSPSCDELRSALEAKLVPLRAQAADLQSSAKATRKDAENSISRQRSELEGRRTEITKWNSAESEWLDVTKDVGAPVAAIALKDAIDGECLIPDPSRADAWLDVTVRYEMFLSRHTTGKPAGYNLHAS